MISSRTPAPDLPQPTVGTATTTGAALDARRRRAALSSSTLRIAGTVALCAIVAAVFLLVAGCASAPSVYVPGRSGGWPHWMAGPLEGLHIGISPLRFELLTALMGAGYLLALGCARHLSMAALAVAIVAAHIILLLGPPLISQDVFGYLAFARMGVLHGLNPYSAVAAQMPGDPILPFIGWPHKHTPYGPLFTLVSYGAAPLGLGGGLWALKALSVAASLGAVALVARAARAAGRSARVAAAFVGLNPVLLQLAVGGAHNDTLILLALSAALVLSAGAAPRWRSAAVTLAMGVGVKLSGGLALPFLALAPRRASERLRVAGAAALALGALAVVGALAFGSHAFAFVGELGEQQRMVAAHSIPAETARLLGLRGTPSWWRHLFAALFFVALAYALWRTARGADWRTAAGWATLALLMCTAWLLPWYAIWPLPLAALSSDRRLRVATLGFCAYALLIHLQLTEPLLGPY
ncbi:MAG: glycosyltransferase 87 family protein [Solirubrobacterales bacterium]|nr:glycosyltransferase 87 family protein [Solirubrobacterales bacterium]